MKTKLNALAIYMASDEVLKSVTSKNLDLKDEIEEKILFLQKVSWKEIFIKWFDEDKKEVKVAEYENYKSFSFPVDILDSEEIEDEEIEEKTKTILEINFNKKMVLIACFIILTILWVLTYNTYVKQNKDISKESISQFELKYNRINEINIEIAKELEIQHKARQIEKDSIKKVKDLENQQKELRLDSLLLSNNIE